MELKPTRDKTGLRSRLDGLGNPLRSSDHRNPWAQLARGVEPKAGGKRRRAFSDTLGATPSRNGPFDAGAADVAVTKPPAARQRQQRVAGAIGNLFVTKK